MRASQSLSTSCWNVMPTAAFRISLLVALVGTVACRSGTGPDYRLVIAQARWAEQGPASYRITVSRLCECLPEMSGPVVVVVRNRLVESRRYTSTDAAVPSTHAALFPTIDGLFDIIEAARREDAARLDVTYDPTYGYPTRIVIDYDAVTVDDEVVYQVRDFSPMTEMSTKVEPR